MVDAELGLTLVCNGCIYNYLELRAELEALGYRFFSDGDTEVILKAWHAWGADAPKRFNGMFASLIGRLRSSAFRLSTTAVSTPLAGSCFSPESAPRPFHDGIRR